MDELGSVSAVPATLALGVHPTDYGLDDAIVAVVALVEDRDLLGLGAHVHEEPVAELLHPAQRVLLEHRLDRETLVLVYPSLARWTGGPIGDLAEDLLLLDRSRPQARLLAMVDRATLDLVDHVGERHLRAGTGRRAPTHRAG